MMVSYVVILMLATLSNAMFMFRPSTSPLKSQLSQRSKQLKLANLNRLPRSQSILGCLTSNDIPNASYNECEKIMDIKSQSRDQFSNLFSPNINSESGIYQQIPLPLSLFSQTPLTTFLDETLARLVQTTQLIADSVEYKNPTLFKISKDLFDEVRKYYAVLLLVKNNLKESDLSSSKSNIDTFNQFLKVLHITELLAIDSDITYLKSINREKAEGSLLSIDEHISFKIGSDALLVSIKKQMKSLNLL